MPSVELDYDLRVKISEVCSELDVDGLRGDRMYAFLDRLINLALPRIRDFRGISGNSFDGRGNYSLGIREQLIFPEIEYDKIAGKVIKIP